MADQAAMAVHPGITTEEAECLVPADESMFIHQYVQYGIEHGDQPIIYFISSALALLSSVMPWGLCTADIEGGITPANFFTLIIGPTGAGHKTTALKRGSRLLHMAGLANRYVSDIGSTQSLEDMLEAQGGQVFLCMAEVGDFLKATVEGPRERDRTWLCKVFDCEPIKSSTRSKGNVSVPNPRLTWQGAVNYEFIEVFTTRSDWDGGLMSRVFIANSACVREDPPYPDEATQAERDLREQWLVARLKQLSKIKIGKRGGGLAEDALPIYQEFKQQIAAKKKELNSARAIAANARAMTMAVKIALLVQADMGFTDASGVWRSSVEQDGWQISGYALWHGIELAKLHWRESLFLGSMVSGTPDGRNIRIVKQALATYFAIHNKRSVPYDWLVRVGLNNDFTVGKLGQYLDTLVAGREVKLGDAPGGGTVVTLIDRAKDAAHSAEHQRLMRDFENDLRIVRD